MKDFVDVQLNYQLNYEKERKIQLIFLLTFLSLFYLAGFAIVTALLGRYVETIILGSIFIIGVFNIIVFRIKRNISLAANVIIISMFLLMVFLFFIGGIEKTGFIWMFIFIPMAFYLLGLKAGCIWSGLLFVTNLAVYLLTYAGYAPRYYSPLFVMMIFSAYLLSAFLVVLYEIVRRKYEGIISENSRRIFDLNEELKRIAEFDFLTGVYNRRVMDMSIRMEAERFRRFDIYFTIIMIDIDNFKSLNDRFGHQFGDEVLKKIAEALNHSVRDIDRVGRFGGEEFIVLLPSTRLRNAGSTAERLLSEIRSLKITADTGEQVPLTASMGLAEIAKGLSEEDLVKAADQALYQAKRKGKDCLVLYQPD